MKRPWQEQTRFDFFGEGIKAGLRSRAEAEIPLLYGGVRMVMYIPGREKSQKGQDVIPYPVGGLLLA